MIACLSGIVEEFCSVATYHMVLPWLLFEETSEVYVENNIIGTLAVSQVTGPLNDNTSVI
jgi:hypothetical protein